jgi:hypothetical protein
MQLKTLVPTVGDLCGERYNDWRGNRKHSGEERVMEGCGEGLIEGTSLHYFSM